MVDPDLRARVAARVLGAMATRQAVAVLHGLQLRGGWLHPERPWVAVAQALLSPTLVEYETRRAWHAEAVAEGLLGVRHALLDTPARRVHRPQADPVPGLTLGERRWRARLRDPNLLEKLRRDPDPAVVANLLRNPRTLELDVVLLASQRPAFAHALTEVARDPRWAAVAAVQLALVQNPYAPTSLSVLLLPLLRPSQLAKVAADGTLHDVVREVAGWLHAQGGSGTAAAVR